MKNDATQTTQPVRAPAVCLYCGYSLRGHVDSVAELRCPECGLEQGGLDPWLFESPLWKRWKPPAGAFHNFDHDAYWIVAKRRIRRFVVWNLSLTAIILATHCFLTVSFSGKYFSTIAPPKACHKYLRPFGRVEHQTYSGNFAEFLVISGVEITPMFPSIFSVPKVAKSLYPVLVLFLISNSMRLIGAAWGDILKRQTVVVATSCMLPIL